MEAIKISNLRKYFKGVKAVDGVDLVVHEGEFFGFLGKNGAGKTTTINSITGLSGFEGEIKVFGRDVRRDYRFTHSQIGLSQQEFNLDNFFKVGQELSYQGGFFGLSGKKLKDRVRELLAQFKLEDKEKEFVTKISGGQKRKVMVAKALVHRPKILILDEPTAGVDVEFRHELWDLLKKLNKEGTTIFLTTHYIEEAEQLCDRIVVIDLGKVVAEGTVSELKNKYGSNSDSLEKIFLKLTSTK